MCTPRQLGILLISQYLCICLLGILLLVHIHLLDCRETADFRMFGTPGHDDSRRAGSCSPDSLTAAMSHCKTPVTSLGHTKGTI